MLIELRHISGADMLKVRDWIMENSPSSKLFIGNIVGEVFLDDWKPVTSGWDIIDHVAKFYKSLDSMFVWAVEIPEKDAVLFKLVWG